MRWDDLGADAAAHTAEVGADTGEGSSEEDLGADVAEGAGARAVEIDADAQALARRQAGALGCLCPSSTRSMFP